MGTRLSVSGGGGKAFDGTDYIYVYGDKDPLGNGQELQSALFRAGIDKVATGRRQTVVVGPGTYMRAPLGSPDAPNYFEFDSSVANIKSLTGDRDVILNNAGPVSALPISKDESGIVNPAKSAEQLYLAEQYLISTYGSNGLTSDKCYSDYITLGDDSMILCTTQSGNSPLNQGTRFVKIENNLYTVGPNILATYNNWNIDRYWIIRNPTTGSYEIYAVGYWSNVNQRIFFRIDPSTLDVDPTFNYCIIQNGLNTDLAIDNNGDIIIVGSFQAINGNASSNIGKISSTGSFVSSWNTGAGFNGQVQTVVYNSSNNRLYCGGSFTTYQGTLSKYFVIIDNVTAGFIAPITNPNSAVSSLKLISGQLYAFGNFTMWGVASTNGRNALLLDDGSFSSVLFNDQVAYFWDSQYIKAPVNDSPRFRFAINYNSNSPLSINGTSVAIGNVIDFDQTSFSVTVYSTANYAPYYDYTGTVFYRIYARADWPNFVAAGNFSYTNVKLLYNNAVDYYQVPDDYNIEGLAINGAFVTGPNNSIDIKINNCSIKSIFDSYAYDNIAQPVYAGYRLYNCDISSIIHSGWARYLKNTTVNSGMFVPNAIRASGNTIAGYLTLEYSNINNAFSGKSSFIMGLNTTNSTIQSSFNGGYVNLNNNEYSRVDSVYATNTKFDNCFVDSKFPRLEMYGGEANNSFIQTNNQYPISNTSLLLQNPVFQGIVLNVIGYNSFVYNFSWALGQNLSNLYFQDFNMNFKNCHMRGESLTFTYVPANVVRDTSFINCSVIEPGGIINNAMNVIVMHDWNANSWGYLGYGNFANIRFENCIANNVTTAFVVGLRLTQSVSQVYIRNIIMNNCSHNSFLYYTDVDITRSSTFFLDSGGGFMTDLVIDRVRFSNCNVDGGFVRHAFFTEFFNLGTLTPIDCEFKNCHVSSRAENYYNGNSSSFFSNISCSSLNIPDNPNLGLRFIDCSTTSGAVTPYSYNYVSPTYYADGFLGNLSIGSFNSYNGGPVIFINCMADRGFVTNNYSGAFIGGTATIYAKDCTAATGSSFGKNVGILQGRFVNCDGARNSFGDAFDLSGTYTSLTATYQNAIFVGCQGEYSFGLDQSANFGFIPILFGGKLYHNLSTNGPSPSSGLISWGIEQYNAG